MTAPSYVFTLGRVAKMLGEDEEPLRELAMDMEPEDECLSVLGPDDNDSIIAFTPFGVENLRELLEDLKERGARRMDTPGSRRFARFRVHATPRRAVLRPNPTQSEVMADVERCGSAYRPP